MESLPRKIWRAIYPAFLLVAMYLFVYFIAMAIYGIFFAGKYSQLDEFMVKWASLISILALIGGGVVSLLLFAKDNVEASVFIFKKPVYFAAVAVMGILASHGLSILVSFIGMTGVLGTYDQTAVELSTSGWILTTIKAVILAPLAEELTFRGLCFNRGRKFMGFWGAAVVSSLLFAIYHGNVLQGIMAFMFGIILCLIYVCFKNVWAAIVMHAAANLLSVVLELTGLSYPSYAVYVIVMVVTLAGAAAIYFLSLKKVKLK